MKTTSLIKNWILLLITLFIFTNCSNDDDNISYELTGNWKVVYFIDNNEKITKTGENTWLDINDGDITATFTEPDSSGKGTISGITVSNGYNGEYAIQNNGGISIGPITTTEINEPEWTDLFLISSAQEYEIINSRLTIYFNGNKNSIVFERN